MLDFDRPDLVRQFRQAFENEMAGRLIEIVERLTGRKVLTYQSQIMFDPDRVIEMFVFDDTVSETAGAVTAGGQAGAGRAGAAAGDAPPEPPAGNGGGALRRAADRG